MLRERTAPQRRRPVRQAAGAGHRRGFAQKGPGFCGQRAAVRRHSHPGAESGRREREHFRKGERRMTLELHATPEEVMRAVETLQAFGCQWGIAGKELFGLALALEECGSNIVNHALQRDARQKFQVLLEHDAGLFTIELRDRGPAFDPTAAAEPIRLREDEDRPGGWGLQLVRRYTDEVHYAREGGENVLRLSKRLDRATAGGSPLC